MLINTVTELIDLKIFEQTPISKNDITEENADNVIERDGGYHYLVNTFDLSPEDIIDDYANQAYTHNKKHRYLLFSCTYY